MGLSKPVIKAYEGEGTVQVCAELLKGELGTTLSIPIEAVLRNTSAGMYMALWLYNHKLILV